MEQSEQAWICAVLHKPGNCHTGLGPFICPAAHTDISSKLAALPLEQRLHGTSVKDSSSL